MLSINKSWKEFSSAKSIFEDLIFNKEYFGDEGNDKWTIGNNIKHFITSNTSDVAYEDVRFIYKMNVSAPKEPVFNLDKSTFLLSLELIILHLIAIKISYSYFL